MTGLLIGGTSHCGKSTLANSLGEALDLRVQSTDKLGRHPGRPWLGIPEPVAEFFAALSDDAIYWFLRVHHDNMWPLLSGQIQQSVDGPGGFVMEGSALRPERMATLEQKGLVCLCLHAPADFLVDRIRRESDYPERDGNMQRLIDTFIRRSLRDNDEIVAAARASGVWLVDASDAGAASEARSTILARLRSQ